MEQLLKKYKLSLLLYALALILALSVWFIFGYIKTNNSPEKKVAEFAELLQERYNLSSKLLNDLAKKDSIPDFKNLHPQANVLPKNTALFVLKDQQPIYWSDNSIPFLNAQEKNRIVKTREGWYQKVSITKGEFSYILLDLIKHEYPYLNDYLSSSFNPAYNLSADYKISLERLSYPVKDDGGKTLFYLGTSQAYHLTIDQEFVLYILFLISFVLLVLATYFTLSEYGLSRWRVILILIGVTFILRLLQFVIGIPLFFHDFELLSPLKYASSRWLPSLGDLLLNITLVTFLAFIIFRTFLDIRLTIKHSWLKALALVVGVALINLIYYITLYLIDTLIINSSFELNLSRILDFSIYSYIGYFIIAMLLLSFFHLTYIIGSMVIQLFKPLVVVCTFIIFSVAVWVWFYLTGSYIPQWEELVLLCVYFLLLVVILIEMVPFPRITTTTSLILVLTIISTYCIYHNSETKENEERKLMALRLSSDQDKVAEFLYNDLEEQILSDTALHNQFIKGYYQPDQESVCIDYLLSKYFNGYWTKFNTQITLCYPEKELEIKPSGEIIGCNNYFGDIISNITSKTANSTLFYFKESYGVSNYIARIPITDKEFKNLPASIVIEFTQKYVPKGLGYPELLLDNSFVTFYDLSVYSYAIYTTGELIKNVGDYSYSISESPFLPFRKANNFFNKNGYNHLYHIVNDDTSIIISKKNLSTLDKLAPFTYQLIFHIILVFIITTVYNLRFSEKRFPDLKSQLQIMLVLLVIFASITTGFTTLKNIRNLNEKKNQDMLSEKAHSVLIEIEHKLDTIHQLEPYHQPYLQELLTKFSLVFFSDINIYDMAGNLQATSRPEIFEEGLRSVFMSSEAYHQMAVNQRTFFVTNEQIGSYKYLSAYIPFRNKDNELIAYINLPFFAREHELRQEISSFLVTFVNLYIILTALAVFISLLVGNYVTRPLQLIRDKFSSVKLDKSNEKIRYTRRDELGNLINTYNSMLDKLSESVDKLAQSERENAWKEMARQIAHEIKNPLTPMKLSIQHLYRSWKDKAPDWENRLEKTTNSIIQQIDSLAAIATAFSDFAKFPQATNEKIKVAELIRDTVALFTAQTQFSISTVFPDQPCYVFADKKQLSRVLVNLLNNAIQSIPAERQGKIQIQLHCDDELVYILVSDNGAGISEEQKLKIFSPNFTTKTSGTGLGLAMVKNIIDSAGGNISFTSDDQGTTFKIVLPAFNNDSERQ